MIDKKFIYFPSLSTFSFKFKNDVVLFDDLKYKFYSDEYGKFKHPYFLLTAGTLYKKMNIREELEMKDILVFGDSGGYQIASGVLKWNVALRENIFNWLEANSDIAMNLDIPPVTNGMSFQDCVNISKENIEWFEKKQNGKTDFLNIVQVYDETRTNAWYNAVKDYTFQGWAWGGNGLKSITPILRTICLFLKNKEFDKKNVKWLHFLGKTGVPHFFIYAVLQNNFNKYY